MDFTGTGKRYATRALFAAYVARERKKSSG